MGEGMAIAVIRITLETLDSAGNQTNKPLVRVVDLVPRSTGRGSRDIAKKVQVAVTGMLSTLRFDEVFESDD